MRSKRSGEYATLYSPLSDYREWESVKYIYIKIALYHM